MATTKPLSERISQADLNRFKARKLTNAELAEKYGVSETYLSRTVSAMGITKEPGVTTEQREAAHKLFKARIDFRDRLAKEVIQGKTTFEKAVKAAKCTERTMFRHMAKYREQAAKGPKAKKRA